VRLRCLSSDPALPGNWRLTPGRSPIAGLLQGGAGGFQGVPRFTMGLECCDTDEDIETYLIFSLQWRCVSLNLGMCFIEEILIFILSE